MSYQRDLTFYEEDLIIEEGMEKKRESLDDAQEVA